MACNMYIGIYTATCMPIFLARYGLPHLFAVKADEMDGTDGIIYSLDCYDYRTHAVRKVGHWEKLIRTEHEEHKHDHEHEHKEHAENLSTHI